MKRLVITEQHGLYTAELHNGRKASGSTLVSALDKLFGPGSWAHLELAFNITEDGKGPEQIAHGQASG